MASTTTSSTPASSSEMPSSKMPSTKAVTSSHKPQSGIQSLEIGLSILEVLIDKNEPMMLKDIAFVMDMNPAKVHRYMVSLIRKQYAQQLSDGRYSVGLRITALGHNSVSEHILLERLLNAAIEMKDVLNCGVQIAKWMGQGPVIIQSVEPDSPISLITRIGSRLPLTVSATGNLFAAYHPESIIKPLMLAEWQAKSASRQLPSLDDSISSGLPDTPHTKASTSSASNNSASDTHSSTTASFHNPSDTSINSASFNNSSSSNAMSESEMASKWQRFTQLKSSIVAQKYSSVAGGLLIGINAISIPVLLPQPSALPLEYAITIIGTAEQLPQEKHPHIAEVVFSIAKQHCIMAA